MDRLSFVRVVLFFVVFYSIAECGPLNDYILDYQPLTYDRNAVHKNHQRVRRSTDTHLYVRFSAYGRNFQLKLSPSEGAFSAGHQVFTDDKGLRYVDTSFIYEGQIKGEPKSSVHVSIHNGSLEGHVDLPETRYHIEPAAKYIDSPSFHTIIYPETHLDTDPYRVRREADAGSCGVGHNHIQEFMEQASRLEKPAPVRKKRETRVEREQVPHNIYSEYSNRQKRSADEPASFSRHKRALGTLNTCPLHMQADPLLFNYFKNTKHGRTVDDSQAEEEILAFFSNHVNAMSEIYRSTRFQTYNGGDPNDGLSFVIHRSTVMRNCAGRSSDFCSNSLDVSNYLDLTSKEDHDAYCLVFTFTYRDFSGGTLGLAWVATEGNTQSGVCGRFSTYTGGVKKSLNTGIVTIINFGKTVPNRVSQLTFAHEAGHNFGSPHDIGSEECAPFGTSRNDASNGNYIMFPSATSGDKPNNGKFSPCSKDNMTRIIQQVVDGTRAQCFVASGQAFCGNKITEGKEECDCGFGDCPASTCCVGRDDDKSRDGCVLTASSVCSPDSGPCCRSDCTYTPQGENKTCEEETECKQQSTCNGNIFSCPEPGHKPNGTFCNDYSKVCVSGECLGPVCSKIVDADGTWEECFLTSETGGGDEELCYVACKHPTTGDCISSQNTDALAKSDNAPFKDMLTDAANRNPDKDGSVLSIRLLPGSACDNFLGYCDTFSKCQRIDSQGPFNQLTNMIFDPVTLNRIKDWIVEHWWAVLLMSVGLVVFMGVFIKVFGYNTPSQDPKKKRRQRQQQQPPRNAQPQHNAQPRQQGRSSGPSSSASAPPPYTTEMDMSHYNRSHGYQQSKPYQFDRLAPGYGKNQL